MNLANNIVAPSCGQHLEHMYAKMRTSQWNRRFLPVDRAQKDRSTVAEGSKRRIENGVGAGQGNGIGLNEVTQPWWEVRLKEAGS